MIQEAFEQFDQGTIDRTRLREDVESRIRRSSNVTELSDVALTILRLNAKYSELNGTPRRREVIDEIEFAFVTTIQSIARSMEPISMRIDALRDLRSNTDAAFSRYLQDTIESLEQAGS